MTRTARPLPVATVLFDLDGTLADSAGDLALALNRVRAEHGLPPVPVGPAARARIVRRARPAGRGHGRHAGPSANFGDLREPFLAHYAVLPRGDHAPVRWRRRAARRGIDARGLRWGIVTNKHTRFTRSGRRCAAAWTQRAAVVVGGDTTPHPKPHPAPLLHAADALGIAPARCVYVGDDLRDIEAGNAAGMATIVADYGYMGTGGDPATWPATGWIAQPLDLLDWLPDLIDGRRPSDP